MINDQKMITDLRPAGTSDCDAVGCSHTPAMRRRVAPEFYQQRRSLLRQRVLFRQDIGIEEQSMEVVEGKVDEILSHLGDKPPVVQCCRVVTIKAGSKRPIKVVLRSLHQE